MLLPSDLRANFMWLAANRRVPSCSPPHRRRLRASSWSGCFTSLPDRAQVLPLPVRGSTIASGAAALTPAESIVDAPNMPARRPRPWPRAGPENGPPMTPTATVAEADQGDHGCDQCLTIRRRLMAVTFLRF